MDKKPRKALLPFSVILSLCIYPIFRSNEFYFGELQVPAVAERYADSLDQIRVYDDGVVKGFVSARDGEVKNCSSSLYSRARGSVQSCCNTQ